SVFDYVTTQDTRKRIFKTIGWVYLAYAVIMLLGHVPTLLRELMGGYSYLEFSHIDPKFYWKQKSWFFADKLTFEYQFFPSQDGSHRWHSRLKYVNDKPDQKKDPADSPWRESEIISEGKMHILLGW